MFSTTLAISTVWALGLCAQFHFHDLCEIWLSEATVWMVHVDECKSNLWSSLLDAEHCWRILAMMQCNFISMEETKELFMKMQRISFWIGLHSTFLLLQIGVMLTRWQCLEQKFSIFRTDWLRVDWTSLTWSSGLWLCALGCKWSWLLVQSQRSYVCLCMCGKVRATWAGTMVCSKGLKGEDAEGVQSRCNDSWWRWCYSVDASMPVQWKVSQCKRQCYRGWHLWQKLQHVPQLQLRKRSRKLLLLRALQARSIPMKVCQQHLGFWNLQIHSMAKMWCTFINGNINSLVGFVLETTDMLKPWTWFRRKT